MKKIVGTILVGFTFLLVGCGTSVSTDDLKANDWLIEAGKDDAEGTPDMIATFSDHIMTLKVDTSSIESTAKDGWEALGEEIGKQLAGQMTITYEYELKKNEIKLQYTEDAEKEAYYKVTKEDKNIIFTPDKEKNDDPDEGKKMVLKPYKKPSTESSSSTEATTSSSSEEKKAASVDDYIKGFEEKSLVVYNKRKMTKDDFGMAPMTAKDAAIFSLVETDNEDEQKNARIFTFDNLEDLNATKAYYDDLGKSSAALFSYTAVDEDKLVLMQFNGDFDQSLVEQYTETASLKLTEPPFDTTTSSSNESEEAAQVEESPETSVAIQQEPEPSSSVETAQLPESTEPSSTQVVEAPASSESANTEGDYTVVRDGEGPNQVAARTGVSVDTLYELNGLDPNNYMMYPGQQLRIR